MRHQRARRRLKRNFSHRKQMLENVVLSLFRHQRIQTTWPRAKAAQRLAERLIAFGKTNTLYARRRVFSVLGDRGVTTKLFEEIAPRFKERNGGFTRVLHLGERKGDAAPMALLELTEKTVIEKKPRKEKAKRPKEGKPEAALKEPPRAKKVAREEVKLPKPLRRPGFFENLKRFFRRKDSP